MFTKHHNHDAYSYPHLRDLRSLCRRVSSLPRMRQDIKFRPYLGRFTFSQLAIADPVVPVPSILDTSSGKCILVMIYQLDVAEIPLILPCFCSSLKHNYLELSAPSHRQGY